MNYKEWKDSKQSEFNKLPIFFAFGNDQFKRAMEKRGLTENDTDQVYALGAGGYYLKKDADVVRDWFNKPDELPELMKDEDFAVDAFYYEMCNHEFGINWQGDWDVCQCFGDCEYGDDKNGCDYLKEMGYDDSVLSAYVAAKRKYYKDAAEHEWF